MSSSDLFEYGAKETIRASQPLAERMRPRTLDEFLGQGHAVGEGTLIKLAVDEDRIFSMILWGPPGCGKTTLARIIAKETRSHFVHFSAVLSGVKEIRGVIKDAKDQLKLHHKRTILFVDEIHRFNKAQQDAFLHHVESGLITLIGATTENPSFEVIAPLLSRCRVITLKPLSEDDVEILLELALKDSERGLGQLQLTLPSDAKALLVDMAGGDARVALSSIEIAAIFAKAKSVKEDQDDSAEILPIHIERALQEKPLLYDKAGEEHYNLISALHKSLRGSDPDAAVYWLGRMLMAGEDPFYVARRMVRFASEDIGNADPHALTVSMSAMEAFKFLGHPEGELALAQAAIYLATAPKSNAAYTAYEAVKESVRHTGTLPAPMHIRNAPTTLMKDLGYGKDYKYAHNYAEGFVSQDYLPEKLEGKRFYHPTDRGYEKTIKQRLDAWQKLKAASKKKKQ